MVELNGEKQYCGKAFRIGNSPLAQAKPVAKNRYFICALIKDEHACLREWALHHRSLCFDKIILYDDSSSHPYDGVVGDLIKEGFVECGSGRTGVGADSPARSTNSCGAVIGETAITALS